MADEPFGSPDQSDEDPQAEWSRRECHDDLEREYKGLCMNCAHRRTCLLPRNEGGVWHCEEYLEES